MGFDPKAPARDELDDAIALADRLDPGWTYAGLMERRAAERMPDAENSAVQAEKALELLPPGTLETTNTGDPPGDDEVPRGMWLYTRLMDLPSDEPLPANVARGLRLETEALAEALVEARKLATYTGEGQTRFQPPDNPAKLDLDYATRIRALARLLHIDVMDRLERGDADGAVESVLAQLALARSLGDEPNMISQLVRNAIDGQAIHGLMGVLSRGRASDAVLARVQALLLEEADAPRLLHALRGERAAYHDTLGKLASGELTAADLGDEKAARPPKGLNRLNLVAGVYYRHNQALGVTMLTRGVEIAKRPTWEQGAGWGEWEDDLRKLSDTPLERQGNAMVTMLMPAFEAAARAEFRIRAMLGSADAAVACVRYRRAEDRWPETLETLVPRYLESVPRDPATGEPLKLTKVDDGLIVYGVGVDRTDDGGRLHPKNHDSVKYDVGVRLLDRRP